MRFLNLFSFIRNGQYKNIGYTSGVFDMIHYGHIEYLKKCQSQCDILIVGINSDSRVQAVKGPHRPRNSQLTRMQNVEALGYFSFIKHTSSLRYIKLIKPHFYFYPLSQSGKKIIMEPDLSFISFVKITDTPNISTTKIIENLEQDGS